MLLLLVHNQSIFQEVSIAEGCSQKPIREDVLLSQLEQELTVNCQLSDEALTYIRNLVQNDLEKENQFKIGTEKYVLKRITELKARKQRLTTAWADGDIDKESYEEARKSTDKEIQEQEKIYNMYVETGTNILETLDNVEKIFENPLFFLKSSQIEVRSAFLRLIFANCYVDNKKARFSLKKSLSLFVKNRDLSLWQDILCNSRGDELQDLLWFGKYIKFFLNNHLFDLPVV